MSQVLDNLYILSKQERIKIIIARDGNLCFICKRPFRQKDKKTIDHWIPLSKGGSWDIDNLRITHIKCNAWKSDRIPNSDGSIPDAPKRIKSKKSKKNRPQVCQICKSGRLLDISEKCYLCGSGPQPIDFPMWAKKPIKECDHAVYFCFGCTIGFIERKPFHRLEQNGRR